MVICHNHYHCMMYRKDDGPRCMVNDDNNNKCSSGASGKKSVVGASQDALIDEPHSSK